MYNIQIEKIAKDLCEKSTCHHKCPNTTDCVVEDDAQLLILENYLPSTLTNEEKVSKKEKQIEEMAKDLYENRPYSELWEEDAQDIAKVLYNAGYRKQSEVAREIFEEIEKCTARKFVLNGEVLWDFSERFANLKKKYTESEEKV